MAPLTIATSSQLPPGEYVWTIPLQAEGADWRVVVVRLTVPEATQFVVLPTVLYGRSQGQQVSYRAEASSEGGWLPLPPELGNTPVNLPVTANPYFLKPGRCAGKMRVTSEGADRWR